MRLTASLALIAGSLVLTACGNSASSSSSSEQQVSPAAARDEAAATRRALAAALATYRSGDRKAAQEQVAEAYVSHFEAVEAPLGKRDEALKERLEHAIADELRASIRTGRPAAAVAAQVKAIAADLARAEAALR